ADFASADLALLLRANCGIVAGAGEGEGEGVAAASRRLVAYLLQSFRADHAEPLPPPPPLTLSHMAPTPSSTAHSAARPANVRSGR
ncbi:hypothetical protein ACWEJ6_41355, partial [Nonomuraea sp. NPDC004702]